MKTSANPSIVGQFNFRMCPKLNSGAEDESEFAVLVSRVPDEAECTFCLFNVVIGIQPT
jgi:hypothetical protein